MDSYFLWDQLEATLNQGEEELEKAMLEMDDDLEEVEV